MSRILKVLARKVLNSRGQWTVKAYVESDNGLSSESHLPLGRSRSPYELAIPNLDKVCDFICVDLSRYLVGKKIEDQFHIDAIIEENYMKHPFLCKALLPVSIAVAKLAATEKRAPLWKYLRQQILMNDAPLNRSPVPFITLFMGGLHKYPFLDGEMLAENMQVVQIVLDTLCNMEAINLARNVYRRLTLRLISEGSYKGIGQDGGIAYFGKDEDMLALAVEEITRYFEIISIKPNFGLALDVAAAHLKVDDYYHLLDCALDCEGMLEYLSGLLERFPIWSIEDPFHVDDVGYWQKLARSYPNLQLVGDDIFACSPNLIREGGAKGIANAFVLKPDFVGTVSGIVNVIASARENNVSVVVSQRSGESCDSFLVDLAAAIDPVGKFAVSLRAGAPYCGERVSKWNRLLEIEEEARVKLPLSFYIS